ncbi:hypothetical protein EV702DRAFT_1044790 [Suillus placidus]|uniref:Uncharacterized protein n=1 Tax=Suillus placidus TaxID=48579 RepID=A0A9P6ZX94_9AGAM|nr:hypothetical protein EV702DRAFT_1044790 [Suillus placidus]
MHIHYKHVVTENKLVFSNASCKTELPFLCDMSKLPSVIRTDPLLSGKIATLKDTLGPLSESSQLAENDLATTVEEEEALNIIYKDEEWGGLQEDDTQENSDKAVKVYQPPIKGFSHVYCVKKITPCVPSDPNLKILDAAPKTAVLVLPKKTPCMSAEKDPTNTMSLCQDYKRLKTKCFLIPGKSKQKSTPPANPTPASPITTTSTPKPGPAAKVRPAPAPKPKGKGKAEDVSAILAAPQGTAPGLVGTLRPYVEIMVNRKRKAIEIEEDSSESEQDNGNDAKDAYMAGRVNGLHTFVSMFEKAFGVLKKEVTEIDGYLTHTQVVRIHEKGLAQSFHHTNGPLQSHQLSAIVESLASSGQMAKNPHSKARNTASIYS